MRWPAALARTAGAVEVEDGLQGGLQNVLAAGEGVGGGEAVVGMQGRQGAFALAKAWPRE